MICYLDASALVKRYLTEHGTAEVDALIARCDLAGSVSLAAVEVSAAFSKAARLKALDLEAAQRCQSMFEEEWPDFVSLDITPTVLNRGMKLAWSHGLRGYDAVHLAAACGWREVLRRPFTLACFDLRLWQAAEQEGLSPSPANLPALLDSWRLR